MRPYAPILAIVALSACAQLAQDPDFTVTPDITGLAVAPSGLRIDFGRAPQGVIDLLDGNYEAHVAQGTENCPAGILQNLRWGALVLTFTGEQFVGWQQDGAFQGRICQR